MTGYKRPPVETRFKEGQSGNPKGRPKNKQRNTPDHASSANDILLREAERPIKVVQDGRPGEMSVIEAAQRSQAKSAINGNAIAQRDFLRRFEIAESARKKEMSEILESWTSYVADARSLLAKAAARGEPKPELIPHPDDVVLDDPRGVFVRGPSTKAQAEELDHFMKLRDAYFLQAALDDKLRSPNEGNDPLDESAALYFGQAFNKTFPLRVRLSEIQMMSLLLHYRAQTKRWLLRKTYRTWRALRDARSRGTRFVSL